MPCSGICRSIYFVRSDDREWEECCLEMGQMDRWGWCGAVVKLELPPSVAESHVGVEIRHRREGYLLKCSVCGGKRSIDA